MDSFVLVAYLNLAASRTLACMNFSLDSKDYSVGTNEKSDSYELW